MIAFISASLPITGSKSPASASDVRSLQYKSNAFGVSSRPSGSCLEMISSLWLGVKSSEFKFFEVDFGER